jgi:GT2 family glycosyltransferase
MDVSIVIVNYNTAQLSVACAESILRQSLRSQIEIIIVDNGSEDDSVSRFRELPPPVKLIENGVNLGFAAANNRGIRESTGRYVLLLNSDTEFLDAGLDSLIDYMDSDSSVALVTCRLLNPDGSTQPSLRRFPTLVSAFMDAFLLTPIMVRIPFLAPLTLLEQDYASAHEIEQAAGAFLLIRRDVFDRIGLLDERFFVYYEDVDFCLRLKQSGYRAVYRPDVAVLHRSGGTFRAHRVAAHAARLTSKVHYFSKHHPEQVWIVKILVSFELFWRTCLALAYAVFRPAQGDRPNRIFNSFLRTLKASWSV